MARRRKSKGLVAILFPDLHRSYRKAKHHMRPDRAIGRALSVPEAKSALRSTFGTKTTRITAASRQRDAEAAARRAKKTTSAKPTKKAAKPDPYKDALTDLARRQSAATKQAQAAKKAAAPKKSVAVRKGDGSGRFDGRKSMVDGDRAAYERALGGAVDPALVPRSPRGRR